jgi:hypothetical protein
MHTEAAAPTSIGSAGPPTTLSPRQALAFPFVATAGLAGFTLSEPVRLNPRLLGSFLVVIVLLLLWELALFAAAVRRRRAFTLGFVPRPQHYVQACAHASIFLYWGWYWPPVYAFAYLIAAQLVFAYAFDMLLAWSRRDGYGLGFGPFPIIFSTNLFLWFKDDWFYMQFAMIAVGFAAKELIRWTRDGRETHIFNPSSFALTVFSVALLAAGATDVTWGQDIAITQFYPPHMYLFLFLVALPGQLLFGVTTMTLSAVLTTYLFGLVYYGATGTYFFYDSYIPIAVFLGMHLLFTDPSTAPRTELGRMIFGALYGISTIALYEWLGAAGLPAFYDKLLQVPLLNLMVRRIDTMVRGQPLSRLDPGTLGRSIPPLRRNLVYMSLWALTFAGMSAAQGVGDGHRGQWIPFWQRACAEDRVGACDYLGQLHATACRAGSGWACNELGVMQADLPMDRAVALGSLQAGCQAGFQPACANLAAIRSGVPLADAAPPLEELAILLRGSKGPIDDRNPERLRARACDQGWAELCGPGRSR